MAIEWAAPRIGSLEYTEGQQAGGVPNLRRTHDEAICDPRISQPARKLSCNKHTPADDSQGPFGSHTNTQRPLNFGLGSGRKFKDHSDSYYCSKKVSIFMSRAVPGISFLAGGIVMVYPSLVVMLCYRLFRIRAAFSDASNFASGNSAFNCAISSKAMSARPWEKEPKQALPSSGPGGAGGANERSVRL